MCFFITDAPNQVIRDIKIESSGVSVPVEGRLNCKTGDPGGFCNVRPTPNKQYVGESGRKQSDGFNEHKADTEHARVSNV